MSSGDDEKPGVVTVATSGIQDVSALLPLLGTEQCERLVTSALQQGLLYAAATPMSIFGSLGVVKAGFVVLWASIDHRLFPGPTLLRNAGFTPAGLGELLVHVAESNRHLYVAEDKLRRSLAKKRIHSVQVNLLSKDLWLWNLRLIAATAFLSSFGLLPYLYLILRFLPHDPFQTTWLYPIMRIVGCSMVAVSIQFIFQLRVLEEAYCRIRFLATDSFLKDHGKSLPEFWDPNERSKNVLDDLRQGRGLNVEGRGDQHSSGPPGKARQIAPPDASLTLDEATKTLIVKDLGKMTSFSFPVFGQVPPDTPPPAMPVPQPPSQRGVQRVTSEHIDAEKGEPIEGVEERPSEDKPRAPIRRPLPRFLANPDRYFTTLLVWLTQASLLFGLVLSVAGYIGCFSVVQASPKNNSRGPLVWLVCEAVLAIIRTLVWASNPAWDDPKSPIALEKVALTEDQVIDRNKSKNSSYGIGWMLDSVTADDMHALIVGINEFNSPLLRNLTECVGDARRVGDYLQDTLLVPRNKVVTLIDAEATKERIVEELKAFAHRGSVSDDAPVVIYFATHSFVDTATKGTYLVPYPTEEVRAGGGVNLDDLKNCALSYNDIVDILKHIAEEKTDNIILILDTCHAGAMGLNEKFSRPPGPKGVGVSSKPVPRGAFTAEQATGEEAGHAPLFETGVIQQPHFVEAVKMSFSEGASSIVGVATGGIQDVSALLPLLGTEQCERLVTAALDKGLLYAAAAPMSIFGSLGLVKAGFIVLWGSFDNSFFPGPKYLTDAGFAPSGLGELLIPVKTDNRELYVAEDRIHRRLAGIRIQSVDVTLWTRNRWSWNLRLLGATILCCCCSLVPYIYLVGKFQSDASRETTWLFPFFRVVGCSLAAMAIQVILQVRILEEVHRRLSFIAADSDIKQNKAMVPGPWDPNKRSKGAIASIRTQEPGAYSPFLKTWSKLVTFTVFGGENGETTTPVRKHHIGVYMVDGLLWGARILMLLGLVISVVGYIGCFSLVQTNSGDSPKGPLTWLLCEAALAVARTFIWAWNPGWDDAPCPILLEKSPPPKVGSSANAGGKEQKSTYGVGWTLESLTADNVHAIVVGESYPDNRHEGAQQVENYLQDTLLVPRDQITVLMNAEATKKKISEALKSLSRRVETGSAILIYIAMHTVMEGNEAFLTLDPDVSTKSRPKPNLQSREDYIPYGHIVNLLAQIGKQSDNITLILDSQYAWVMGQSKKPQSPPVPGSKDEGVQVSGEVAQTHAEKQPNGMDEPMNGVGGDGKDVVGQANGMGAREIQQLEARAAEQPDGTNDPVNGVGGDGGGGLRRANDMDVQGDGGAGQAIVNPEGQPNGINEPVNGVGSGGWGAAGHSNAIEIQASRGVDKRQPGLDKTGLVGHSSHILLGPIAENHQGLEFTDQLLKVLGTNNGDDGEKLQTMTYKDLVEEMQRKLSSSNSEPSARKAFCTSFYQNRLLFNGLFSNRRKAPFPFITVKYSDARLSDAPLAPAPPTAVEQPPPVTGAKPDTGAPVSGGSPTDIEPTE